jgi:hypothetical protein
MLYLNMRVEVGNGARLVFASSTRQPINDADGTKLGQEFGLGKERYHDGHTSSIDMDALAINRVKHADVSA